MSTELRNWRSARGGSCGRRLLGCCKKGVGNPKISAPMPLRSCHDSSFACLRATTKFVAMAVTACSDPKQRQRTPRCFTLSFWDPVNCENAHVFPELPLCAVLGVVFAALLACLLVQYLHSFLVCGAYRLPLARIPLASPNVLPVVLHQC